MVNQTSVRTINMGKLSSKSLTVLKCLDGIKTSPIIKLQHTRAVSSWKPKKGTVQANKRKSGFRIKVKDDVTLRTKRLVSISVLK